MRVYFFDHFVNSNVAAIGHIDRFLPRNSERIPSLEVLAERFANQAERNSEPQRSATTRFNQVRRFINEIDVGDWILTVDSDRLIVGRVDSEAYIDNEPVFWQSATEAEPSEMRFRLRRRVFWGPRFRRSRLPVAVVRSIRSNLTLFNIDDHWRAIHHLTLPFFIKSDRVYLSLWIDRKDPVSGFDFSQLIEHFTDFEVVSADPDRLGLQETRSERLQNIRSGTEKSSLNVQAQIMSPGPLWMDLLMPTGATVNILIIYIMLFGGKLPFFETDGLIDKAIRHKIADYIGEQWTNNYGPALMSRLKIKRPPEKGLELLEKPEDRQ